MPRIVVLSAVLWLAGCVFNADYTGGRYLCSDGVCPSGSVCVRGLCQAATPSDALRDGHAGSDATPFALTCAMPGTLTAGVPASGSTTTRTNGVSGFCSDTIMNGPDAVYTIAVGAGSSLQISVSGDYAVVAYALAACQVYPATPACEGGSAAMPGTPITVTPVATGTQYVVVDSILAAGSGSYTLTVTTP